jgi:predicted SprT family Zn-dependent metalloprotease
MKPTENQFLSYQRIFDYFNEKLFGGQLPGVILNFSRKANTHGFFAPERWEETTKVKTKSHEISLNPQTLGRDPRLVYSTLVHEMVHLWQEQFGKPSRSTYHNKEWAAKMEAIGLIPSNTGKPGGKKTGQSMTHYIEQNGPFDQAFRSMPAELSKLPFIDIEYVMIEPDPDGEDDGEEGEGKSKKKKTNSKVKYTCPGCSMNTWGKEGLNLMCGDCNEHLIQQ